MSEGESSTTTQRLESSKVVWTVPPQPAALTAFKITGVAASSALLLTLLARIVIALAAGASAWLVFPAFLLGYVFADLLSGTAHWFCDTFFEEDAPLIGQLVIRPFRDHHLHPQRITRYRFIEQDTVSFLLMLPPLAVAYWLGARLCRGRRRAVLVLLPPGSGHGIIRDQSLPQVGACAEAASSRALAPTQRPHPHARAPPAPSSRPQPRVLRDHRLDEPPARRPPLLSTGRVRGAFLPTMTERLQPQRLRIGEGKISGYLSIFLALISLGAVICFHFPEYFTTPEFRAVYSVDVLRWCPADS